MFAPVPFVPVSRTQTLRAIPHTIANTRSYSSVAPCHSPGALRDSAARAVAKQPVLERQGRGDVPEHDGWPAGAAGDPRGGEETRGDGRGGRGGGRGGGG